MSISASLANALTGLNAAARGAEIVSSNVANALNDGYGRRDLHLRAQSVGGKGAGVSVAAVVRNIDQSNLDQRRLTDAEFGAGSARLEYFGALEKAVGLPDDPSSLSGRVARFAATLIEAASRPESQTRLVAVFEAAEGLSGKLSEASGQIQQLRENADRDIAAQVSSLNEHLGRIVRLNREIRDQLSSGNDALALMDQRQKTVDTISTLLPVREAMRANGEIALYSPNGALLVDGREAVIGFSPSKVITPDMTLAGGALSGLTVNGIPIFTGQRGPLSGGSIGALLQIRDEFAPQAQSEMDAIARDLIERFASPTMDSSLATGDMGLFDDAGVVFASENEIGIARRISVSSLVDPAKGGALWKLRDGLGATAPGPSGNAELLYSMHDALSESRAPASGRYVGIPSGFGALADEFLSSIHGKQRAADRELSFVAANLDMLKLEERKGGVDSDFEMQRLLLIEQNYAANARVISTADEMLQTLLRM